MKDSKLVSVEGDAAHGGQYAITYTFYQHVAKIQE